MQVERQHYPATGKAAVVVWLVTILLGLGGAGAVVAQFPKDSPWWVFVGAFFGIFGCSLAIAVWIDRSIDRRRVAGIELALLRENFAPRMGLETSDPVPEFLMVPALAFIRAPRDWFHWVATKPLPPRQVVAFEHMYVIGSGKTTRAILHTAVAWPIKRNVPVIWLTRTSALDRWQDKRQGVQDIPIGDETFDKGWRVQCGDVEHARQFLTPRLRALIDAGPKRERWVIGQTHACCIFNAQTNGEGVAAMLQRARAVAELVEEPG